MDMSMQSPQLHPPKGRMTFDALESMPEGKGANVIRYIKARVDSVLERDGERVAQRFVGTLDPDATHKLEEVNLSSINTALIICEREHNFRALNNMLYFADIFNDRIQKRGKIIPRLDNLHTLLVGLEMERGASIPRESFTPTVEDYSIYPFVELQKQRAVMSFVLRTEYPDPYLSNPIWISVENEQFITEHYDQVDRIIAYTNSHGLRIQYESDFDTLIGLMADAPSHPALIEGQL